MQRLGKNIGRYFGECIDIDCVLEEIHILAEGTGWHHEVFHQANGVPLRGYWRTKNKGKKNIYLSTGIHGDEPSGPLALRALFMETRALAGTRASV